MKKNNNKLIVANVKLEECYSGLSLTFEDDDSLREEIEFSISKIKDMMKLYPFICNNSKN